MPETLIALIVAEVAKRVPALAIEMVRILSKKDATDADWAALQGKYEGMTYDQYLAEARNKPQS